MLFSTLLYILGIMSIGYSLPVTLNETDYADEMMSILERDFPTDLTGSIIQKRESGGIFICTDIYFSGTCGYAKQPLGVCIVLTSPYKDTISSFGPDEGYAAQVYATSSCSGTDYTFYYPGSDDLRNQGWNDRIGSFIVLGVVGSTGGSSPDNRGFEIAATSAPSDSTSIISTVTTLFLEAREEEATAKPTSTPSQGYTHDKRDVEEATKKPTSSAQPTASAKPTKK